MGCDIHWLLEVQGPDGTWHALHSKRYAHYLWEMHDGNFDRIFDGPDRVLGLRNYDWFGILSGVRGDPLPRGPLMTPGLPEDISAHGADYLEDDCDLHSHGYTMIAPLRAQLRSFQTHGGKHDHADFDESTDLRDLGKHYTRLLDAFFTPGGLEDMMPEGVPLRLLRGRGYCMETDRDFPDMDHSAHGALADAEILQKMMPVNEKRARLVIAYDN